MSDFKCPVVRVKIESHPNADAIEIARVGDYQSIVKKGQFKDGDLAVYIPEQAVLPEWLLKKMGFWDELNSKGTLHGSGGNRVKAIKLRGVVSQGLVLAGNSGDVEQPAWLLLTADRSNADGPLFESRGFEEGDDASEFLGIKKYEIPIPSHMTAKVIGAFWDLTAKYDFDNIKGMPNLFREDDFVVITEKIHGTLMCIGVVPESKADEKFYKGRAFVTSKGMGAKGFILDHNDPTNLYAQAAHKHGLFDVTLQYLGSLADSHQEPVFIWGELYGKTASGAGIQDLTYDGEQLAFRAFDLSIGNRGTEKFAPFGAFEYFAEQMGIPLVPVLYKGKYSREKLLELTDGPTTLGEGHIREGVVIKCAFEDKDPKFGRRIAKSVSADYLLRKNATEFN